MSSISAEEPHSPVPRPGHRRNISGASNFSDFSDPEHGLGLKSRRGESPFLQGRTLLGGGDRTGGATGGGGVAHDDSSCKGSVVKQRRGNEDGDDTMAGRDEGSPKAHKAHHGAAGRHRSASGSKRGKAKRGPLAAACRRFRRRCPRAYGAYRCCHRWAVMLAPAVVLLLIAPVFRRGHAHGYEMVAEWARHVKPCHLSPPATAQPRPHFD